MAVYSLFAWVQSVFHIVVDGHFDCEGEESGQRVRTEILSLLEQKAFVDKVCYSMSINYDTVSNTN